MKILIALLLVVLLGTGCTRTVEKLVYVKASCPKIQVLKPVGKIDGNITNGCVCDTQLKELLMGTSQLRKSENYYIEQVGKYNNNFTTDIK